MNETEVRFMLENRADIIKSIAVMSKMHRETKAEVIEAVCLSATCYDKDRIQSGGDGDTVTQTILRAEREYRDCLKSHSDIQFLCETRERQLRDLDMCRRNLLQIAQEILRLRFDEHYTVAETATYTGRPSRAIGKITTESIKTIAGLMSRKGW